MVRLNTLTPASALIVLHDLVVTAAAIVASFYIRFEDSGLAERLDCLVVVLPGFLVYAGIVYFVLPSRRGEVALRLAARPLQHLPLGRRVLAVSLLVLDYILVAPNLYGTFFFGKITIAALLGPADVLPGRAAHRLSLFPLRAHAAARARSPMPRRP